MELLFAHYIAFSSVELFQKYVMVIESFSSITRSDKALRLILILYKYGKSFHGSHIFCDAGPFWMWVLASRASILKKFSTTPMEDLLEEATAERNDDSSREEFNAIGFDEDNDIDG